MNPMKIEEWEKLPGKGLNNALVKWLASVPVGTPIRCHRSELPSTLATKEVNTALLWSRLGKPARKLGLILSLRSLDSEHFAILVRRADEREQQ